jgi:diaminohydroxyphosphoribosylaminopyrimidine deaminase / 5-amino-6-(5-phosphoribosylamino)uracil reductase
MTMDEKWMRRALVLAEKGRGRVSPNPMVGAVLVRGGRIVGEGFHPLFGKAHAEIEAIRKAGNKARGSTLYVNLEPCAHWGKTPPCVNALIRAGVRRVVAAMRDPNPLVSGKGFAALRRQGTSVTIGVLNQDAEQLNRAFVTWVKKNRPYVTLKVASSLDGRTSTITGESQWITGEKARRAGHVLRARADAVAVGVHTVRSDNPSLTTHGQGGHPIRIIFDSRMRAPLRARVFNKEAPTWLLATDRAVLKQMDQFKRKGVQVLLCHPDAQGRISVKDALRRLAGRGITHLLVEGGMTLQQSFLESGMVDEVAWFIAPLIIGNAKRLKDAWKLDRLDVERIGPDLRVSACLPESSRRSAK